MDSAHWPLILIEGVLVFGGALAFAWWQLRSVKRDREALLARRQQEQAQKALAVTQDEAHAGGEKADPPSPPLH